MSTDENIKSITVEAGSDLSAAQYKFVNMATDGQVDLAGTQGIDVLGVLQNDPAAAGRAATVAVSGVSKVVAGGAINPGAKVMTSNAGVALAATGTNVVVGVHVGKVAAASGDIIPVLLKQGGGHLALS